MSLISEAETFSSFYWSFAFPLLWIASVFPGLFVSCFPGLFVSFLLICDSSDPGSVSTICCPLVACLFTLFMESCCTRVLHFNITNSTNLFLYRLGFCGLQKLRPFFGHSALLGRPWGGVRGEWLLQLGQPGLNSAWEVYRLGELDRKLPYLWVPPSSLVKLGWGGIPWWPNG